MNNSEHIFSSICNSQLWDSRLSWNTSEPRLTSCIIETLFVWIPSTFLWMYFPYVITVFMGLNVNPIPCNAYNISRLIVSALLTFVTIIDLSSSFIIQLHYEDSPTIAHFLSTVIYSITRLGLCLIFFLQKVFGIHCTGIVFFYLLIETVLGGLTTASYSMEPLRQRHEYALHMIEYSLTVILFLFCCFADRLPPNTFKIKVDSNSEVCPKYSASFPSKLTFWWITGLIFKGWKKPLNEDDLWKIRKEDRCRNVFKIFNEQWIRQKFGIFNHHDKILNWKISSSKYQSLINSDQTEVNPKKTKLMSIIIKTFWSYFLVPNLLKIVADITQMGIPLIIKILISFTTSDEPLWHGYIYAVLLFSINFNHSITTGYYHQQMSVLGMRIRSCLISAVYRKSLVLSSCAKKDTTTGEIVNLMAVDSQRFVDLLPVVCHLWSTPIQIGIALWLLYNELGMAVFGGLFVILLFILINSYVSSLIKMIQTKQMKLKDKRLRTMNEILNGIKILKLYGWEEAFIDNVLDIRNKELFLIRKSGFLNTLVVMQNICVPFFVSLAIFAIYILIDPDNNKLDTEKVFVSLALINLLRTPMLVFNKMISLLVMTLVSVKRLENFLNASELISYVTRITHQKEIVKIENGTFMWNRIEGDEEIKPVLDKINLKILKGKFVAIVGSVGSGKSSLLNALLGEMEKCSGIVNISGEAQIAYVPQQAWIQNATLKDNILFGKVVDHYMYEEVLRACALKQDLLTLSGGDQTEIGENGINLSGGQKQRVSLARAVYSEADLYLMDDPLSAVDSHVGRHIFDEVLSSKTGLLRNKTRILVTNSLFVLSDVDYIVVLKNGRITECGTYNQLMAQKGNFSELITQYTRNNVTDVYTVSNEDLKPTLHTTSTTEAPTSNGSSKLVESERAEIGDVSFSIYKKFAKSMSLFWALSIIIGFAATHTANSGSGFWLSDWTKDTSSDEDYAYRLGVYALFGLVQIFASSFNWLSIVAGTLLASCSFHSKLLYKIMHAPMHFFDTTPLGRILNRFSKDIDILDTNIPLTLRVLGDTTFLILSSFVVISIQTPIIIIICIPIIAIYYLIQKLYIKTSRQLKRLESITRSPIYSHFTETISGVSTIRAFGVKERFIKGSDNRVDENHVCFYPNAIANCWLSVRLEFLANCVIFFAALLVVISKDTLMGGQIGLSLTYALNITLSLNWAVRMFAETENNVVAVERIDEYTQIESEAEWHSSNPPSKEWPQNGCIEFVEYGTRYREGLDLVLKGIDIKVEKGEKVGIIGRTGAGKSSLSLALFRLIEASFGRIVIDDIDISKIGLQELRSRLTIIPQDPVLFAGTIRSNLDPFVSYTDEQIWTALEDSYLHEFVKGLDSGIYYTVSEGGENLSVGQRQLICLGRALLRNTNILVLDEATAAVDVETDALIQTTIRNEFSRCTVLTIAHRLNTIMDSDRVLVLHEGRVAEFDSPQNLLRNKKTIFYCLAKDARLV